ncbi:MAG: signal peptide peptidase SppA [Kordiimonadaceae bacterium]|nr:signal peptide peptidase SppA [Kordiimonadaceae bacterium]
MPTLNMDGASRMKGIWALIKSIGKFIQGLGSFTIGFLVLATFAIIVTASNNNKRPEVIDGAVLILWPEGNIVEQAVYPDPFADVIPQLGNQSKEISVHDITRALKRAKNDQRISALALITDSMRGVGPSHLHAIAAAIRDFKEGGKKVYAISTAYSQDGYMLAAEADKIFMNPYGSILLPGYGNFPMYFKDGLDKLGATMNIFRVGTYKAAVEPFLRNDMSPAAKEANMAFLGSLWSQYTASVETARGMETGTLQGDIANMADQLRDVSGDFATLAVHTKLVDELAPRKTWRHALMKEYGSNKEGNSFNQIHFQTYLAATDHAQNHAKNVAVITAQGPIVMGSGPITQTAAETLVGYIREARNSKKTAAIVLRVNSGGGSAFASELIRQELVAAQEQGIKIIASMGPVAASGGYWISATADEIWAAPSTITGSIGIFGMIPTFENTLAKIGVHSDGVGTTPLAGAFDTNRPLSTMTKDIIQQSIEAGYSQFINLVAEGRNMTPEAVDTIAQGRVWSGVKAHELGLVDHLGGFQDAVKAAAAAADIERYNVVFYRDKPDDFKLMLSEILKSTIGLETLQPVFGSKISPLLNKALEISKEAEFMVNLNDPMGRYVVCMNCAVQ